MTICKNLIGDTWLTPTGDASFESRNPANPDDILGIFPMATREDARQAIDAARQAFPAWSALPAPDRGAILDKASQLIDARLDDLAIMLTREEGKTRDEAKAEMIRARDVFRYYSGEGWRPSGQVLPSSILGEHLYTQREPLGVISIITPWNFPAAIPAWKIAPALVYGNTVVFKPASDAPRIGLILVEILLEAGVPFGVINFITGSGKVVGDELCGNDGINGISFTGSYKVGSSIYNLAVKNMTRVQLEMGGKNPLIVLNDADLDLAVPLAVKGGFGVTGQACTASSRVIVEEGIADDFAGALAEAARNLVIGDGLEEKTQMGPAASQSQLETDLYYSKVGQDEGAMLLAGGEIAKEGGYYVPVSYTHLRAHET